MMDPDGEVHRLLSGRPPSHQSGSFPRGYLPSGEAVLFETRPALLVYLMGGLLAVVMASLLGGLLYLSAANIATSSSLNSAQAGSVTSAIQLLSALLIALGVGILAIALVKWYSTAYVLTNRRVIRKFGLFGRVIVDARFERIQAVTLTQAGGSRAGGFGHLHFSLSTPSSRFSAFSGIQQGGILWYAVPDPLEVRAFMEDAFDTFTRLDRSGVRVVLEED
jgi:hypothetical protein